MSYRVPEAVNLYNVYNGKNRLVGNTGAIELPGFAYITNTISLSGMAGEYDAPVLGHVASQKIKIPFSQIDETAYFEMVKGQDNIILRANIQTKEIETGKIVMVPMVVTIRGATTEFNLGSVEKAKQMNADITKEVSYIKVVINNVVCLEYDKFNSIFVINNEDMLKEVRANI